MAGEVGVRIGQRIKQRRGELKLTQKQVAKKMASDAVDGQRISDWERAYNQPSERYLLELVAALELDDVSYFYEAPAEVTPPDLSNGTGQLDRIEHDLKELAETVDALYKAFEETLAAQIDEAVDEDRSQADDNPGEEGLEDQA